MSLVDRLKELAGAKDDPLVSLPPDMSEEPSDDGAGGWEVSLKKKRRSAMMKQMLEQAGYGELAKMINIHEDK